MCIVATRYWSVVVYLCDASRPCCRSGKLLFRSFLFHVLAKCFGRLRNLGLSCQQLLRSFSSSSTVQHPFPILYQGLTNYSCFCFKATVGFWARERKGGIRVSCPLFYANFPDIVSPYKRGYFPVRQYLPVTVVPDCLRHWQSWWLFTFQPRLWKEEKRKEGKKKKKV
jgi:hypothetical protein